jgi:hypothetical protein
MQMQRQKMNVEKMQDICTLNREKKTPKLFSSLACESQLGCIVSTSVVSLAGFDSGVPMIDPFESQQNRNVGNGHTVPFSDEYQNAWKLQVGPIKRRYGSLKLQQLPGHFAL